MSGGKGSWEERRRKGSRVLGLLRSLVGERTQLESPEIQPSALCKHEAAVQAACRGRGHSVPGTVLGPKPGSVPPHYPSTPPPTKARPGLLFILPGTQRLQEQHVIDNKPRAGQGLARHWVSVQIAGVGWRAAGGAFQNKSLVSPKSPSPSPGVHTPIR